MRQSKDYGFYICYNKNKLKPLKHLTKSNTYVIIVLGDKMNITKGRGYVYSIQYYIVWCVKYRHKILTDEIEKSLIEIIHKIATDNRFSILECNGDSDHVHLLIDCSPQHYIPNMIKALKGVSARLLMIRYGDELKSKLWGGHLWNPSYFIATVSENTEEQIRAYIQSQKVK